MPALMQVALCRTCGGAQQALLIPGKTHAQRFLHKKIAERHLKLDAHGVLLQVFEYLSTDLKKFMDRTGKGNANPMPPMLIKVSVQVTQSFVCF